MLLLPENFRSPNRIGFGPPTVATEALGVGGLGTGGGPMGREGEGGGGNGAGGGIGHGVVTEELTERPDDLPEGSGHLPMMVKTTKWMIYLYVLLLPFCIPGNRHK